MCTDGSRKHTFIPLEEAMSPTIALEVLFVSLLIDYHEGRAVQTFYIMGAYLHASLTDDKVVHMKSESEFMDIMCEVNPEHETFVTYEKDKKVLDVLILKVIYVMIYNALVWYHYFYKTLSELGF